MHDVITRGSPIVGFRNPSRWFAHVASVSTIVVVALAGIVGTTVRQPSASAVASYLPALDVPVGPSPGAAAAGDLDLDGDRDLAVGLTYSNQVVVMRNDGNGSFVKSVTYDIGGSPTSMASADINGDSWPDLVVAMREPASSRGVAILLNDRVGGFLPRTFFSAGPRPMTLAVADLNDDGDLDLVTGHCCDLPHDSNRYVSVMIALPGVAFAAPVHYLTGAGIATDVRLVDVNRDGRTDLVAALQYSDGFAVLNGKGDGTFEAARVTSLGSGSLTSALAVDDLNGDGTQDVAIVAEGAGTVMVLSGDGAGGFVRSATIVVGSRPLYVESADVDGDDRNDLVIANGASANVSVVTHSGSAAFEPARQFPVGLEPHTPIVAPFDTGTSLDVVTVNSGSNTVSLLRNLMATSIPTTTTTTSTTTTVPATVTPTTVAPPVSGPLVGWGNNANGQLAIQAPHAQTRPVVLPVGFTAARIAAGGLHTVVSDQFGNVWTWGSNSFGQLGDGMTVSRSMPRPVSGLNDVIAVGAGRYNSYALRSDGTVWAWGRNDSGQVGNGTFAAQPRPVPVAGLSNVRAIGIGDHHALALLNDGTVKAWGYNYYFELGDRTQLSRSTPVTVLGLSGVEQVAAGDIHSMALRADGTVVAWGQDAFGQLGDGTPGGNRSVPSAVPGLSNVRRIAAGQFHSLAVTSDGAVRAWGWNAHGQLGNGSFVNSASPVVVSDASGIVDIVGGAGHSAALRDDGRVLAWGENARGSVGDGSTTNRPNARVIDGLRSVTAIATTGGNHTIAIGLVMQPSPVTTTSTTALSTTTVPATTTSTVTTSTTTMVPATTMSTVMTSTTTSTSTTVPVSSTTVPSTSGKGLFGWGWGAAAPASMVLSPMSVPYPPGVTRFVAFSAGDEHNLAIGDNGKTYASGANTFGALGVGTAEPHQTFPFVEVRMPVGVTRFVSVAAGGKFSLALTDTGELYGWGVNQFGQLGTATSGPDTNLTPRAASMPQGVTFTAIAAGYANGVALGSDGRVYTWGALTTALSGAASGVQIGPVPVDFPVTASRIVQISSGMASIYAVDSNGHGYAWGMAGTLGNATPYGSSSPIPMTMPAGVRFASIDGGASHALAVSTSGVLYAWGSNTWGEQGNPTTSGVPVAVTVPAGLTFLRAEAANHVSMAISADGRAWSWGWNQYGTLGDGTQISRGTPTEIPGLRNAVLIASGIYQGYVVADPI